MEETLQKRLRISSSNLVALSAAIAKRHEEDKPEAVLHDGPALLVRWVPASPPLPASLVASLPSDLAALVVVSAFYSGDVVGLERAA